MQSCIVLVALLGLGLSSAQSTPAAAAPAAGVNSSVCSPLPPPPPERLVAASTNGAANPALINSLVAAVDQARLFNDSKVAVDLPLAAPPVEIAAAFQALGLPDPATKPGPYQTDPALNASLQAFLQRWAAAPGSELHPSAQSLSAGPPPDWIQALADPTVGAWAESLYHGWDQLTRQADAHAETAPGLFSLLWVPRPFVVSGPQSREAGYWSSYWVVKGLLASNLTELATDVVTNSIYLVEQLGHVPSGTRSYFVGRSQPPLLSEMVRAVYNATQDRALLMRAMPALLTEHAYWTSPPKQVTAVAPDGKSSYQLSRYYAAWDQPRPERRLEDREVARAAGFDPDSPAAHQIYLDLASAAESGWDFSSRWLPEDNANLSSIRTTKVVPADLNAFLYQMERNIASAAETLGCADVAQQYAQLAKQRAAAINALMWDPQSEQWKDLICDEHAGTVPAAEAHSGDEVLALAAAVSPAAEAQAVGAAQQTCAVTWSTAAVASNWVPLWAGIAEPGSPQALQAVESFGIYGFNQASGVPASTVATGQQWDFPNVFPPVASMMIDGFDAFGGAPGKDLASQMAQRFLTNALASFESTGANAASFNAAAAGSPGTGGEYGVTAGFGWTNGVALDLLRKYGYHDIAKAPSSELPPALTVLPGAPAGE